MFCVVVGSLFAAWAVVGVAVFVRVGERLWGVGILVSETPFPAHLSDREGELFAEVVQYLLDSMDLNPALQHVAAFLKGS